MIRVAKLHELADVLAIAAESFTRPADQLTAPVLLDLLAGGATLRVDVVGAGLVRGFMLTERRPGAEVVRWIAVGADFRRLGIGLNLLEWTVKPASAWVRKSNAGSRKLFAGAGWDVCHHSAKRSGWIQFFRTAE